MHTSAVIWLTASIIGFLLWWPIGACILGCILITALSQQVTGYRPTGITQRQPSIHLGNLSEREQTLRQIEADQTEIRLITDRLRNAKSDAEFNRIMSSQKKLGGYRN